MAKAKAKAKVKAPGKKRKNNPNNKEDFTSLFAKKERPEPEGGKKVKRKGEEFRKAYGLPKYMWHQFITDHLRKAGLKGRTLEDARKEMIRGAHKWRLVRAHGSPIYPLDPGHADGKLDEFEIMKYVGRTDYDYFPHRVTLREGARVIVIADSHLKRKEVPVITRGKGYLFLVPRKDLMHAPVKLSPRQQKEAWREIELYLESPGAIALEKKFGIKRTG